MAHGRNRPSPFILFSRKLVANDQLVLSLFAVVIGLAVGLAAVGFAELIDLLQALFLGVRGEFIVDFIRAKPAWQIVLIPAVGGLLVGLLIYYTMPGRRPRGPADVIEAAETAGGRMSVREGFVAMFASALSIGAGASVGREGPAVHLGATIASWLADVLRLSRSNVRVMLGCGVAAAVSASFNAPIAGALFAQEVILSRYALKAFAPVVIASVAGAVVSRSLMTNFTMLELNAEVLRSHWEFPAFGGLGIASGLLAIILISGILNTQKQVAKLPIPFWSRPMFGGALVGVIALWYPQVLGIGYEATDAALRGNYEFILLSALFIFKTIATIISLGFGFGGGVFSPSLVIGAMFGGSFGAVATMILPELSSGAQAYSMIGMAAMAAAVLGAPISTTLIVFELSGDYTFTIAVMLACVLATLVTHQCGWKSFFLEQLAGRGVDIEGNFTRSLLTELQVGQYQNRSGSYINIDAGFQDVKRKLAGSRDGMVFVLSHDRALYGVIHWKDISTIDLRGAEDWLLAADLADTRPPVLQTTDTFEVGFNVFAETDCRQIAVVDRAQGGAFVGVIEERELHRAYNEAVMRKRQQEHGD